MHNKQLSAEGGSTASIAPGLDGPARLAAFNALPQSERDAAWHLLREQVEERESVARAEVVAP